MRARIRVKNTLAVLVVARCQRARHKHENNRKAVQTLKTGSLILCFEKLFHSLCADNGDISSPKRFVLISLVCIL